MPDLILLSICVVITLLSALLTTYIAQGRPFWRWFIIGLVLPYVSIFIAMIVVYREHKAEEREAARRS
ncbi:hypothetical protein F0P96_17845 [Hymenobacter busanensis]|uniref:Uncharacterized protein n=1 Tax=Hymenobacter busanensis TaxID=2607656 RepID=A0A7L4ZSB3_9BACT|nr:hypothetical protein [Hymenobacter busanensis]KAA9327102.1 hypothetical protein F0P96_17845 [Hymenobacter busanensis]QHJ05767.1 hypothetical protein GUY19_00045 [Hymenobacter busanensis]